MSEASEAVSVVKVEPENVGTLFRRATDVAGVCAEIVKRTAKSIQGKKYVQVEGWQAIATAYGCIVSSRDVESVPGGVRAIGEVRRVSDGVVLATAEGFCGDDEKTWAARPLFARRAMAQTRSQSRAARAAFSFVVVMIDSDLSTTPAEEMEGMVDAAKSPPPAPLGIEKLKRAVVAAPKPPPSPARKLVIPAEPPPHTDADAPPEAAEDAHFVPSGPAPSVAGARTHDGSMSFRFGRDKGIAVADLDEGSLRFYESACKRDLADESKARFHASTTVQLATVQAELRFRGLI